MGRPVARHFDEAELCFPARPGVLKHREASLGAHGAADGSGIHFALWPLGARVEDVLHENRRESTISISRNVEFKVLILVTFRRFFSSKYFFIL